MKISEEEGVHISFFRIQSSDSIDPVDMILHAGESYWGTTPAQMLKVVTPTSIPGLVAVELTVPGAPESTPLYICPHASKQTMSSETVPKASLQSASDMTGAQTKLPSRSSRQTESPTSRASPASGS